MFNFPFFGALCGRLVHSGLIDRPWGELVWSPAVSKVKNKPLTTERNYIKQNTTNKPTNDTREACLQAEKV